MQDYRGAEIGMIFQDPMTSLNPVYRIGEQIAEAIRTHESVDKRGGEGARGGVAAPGRDPESGDRGSTTSRTSSRAACASAR